MIDVVETKPLDEAVWQAWVRNGIAEDKRSKATRIWALHWILVLALLAGGIFEPFR